MTIGIGDCEKDQMGRSVASENRHPPFCVVSDMLQCPGAGIRKRATDFDDLTIFPENVNACSLRKLICWFVGFVESNVNNAEFGFDYAELALEYSEDVRNSHGVIISPFGCSVLPRLVDGSSYPSPCPVCLCEEFRLGEITSFPAQNASRCLKPEEMRPSRG